MSDLVKAALNTIVDGGTLSLDEARGAMGAVMDGEATPAQLAALLMGLRMRGETVDELAGFATAMRERVVRVDAPDGAIDVVGTGGDGSGTFNISTTAALVAAAAGVPVAKHGNRAITSRAGSADVLDALGIRIDHDAASAGAALRDLGFAFLFAMNFHPAMRHAGPTRREIGVRTAFNLLGPLTNPAGTRRQLLGVGDAAVAARMAEVVQRLGTDRTFVIHGDGVDELPLDGSGVLYVIADGAIERHVIDATALGFKRAATARLGGGTPEENARMTEAVLRGEPGIRRDVVLLNAGAALLVAGVVEQMEDGIERAALTIDAGLASELLEGLRAERIAADAAGDRVTVATRRNVVAEIAERRRADILAEVEATDPATMIDAAIASTRPRPIVDRLATPGLHLIAEIKRASPSAGRIAEAGEDIVARARAYEAGGAAAISVLCEPHWFGGSVDDLRAVRAAVAVPVLAKDFVVEDIQLPILRAAGADLVLLLAVLHPAKRLARLVERALEIGLEPLVEVHDERELDAALASGARLIGLNNRDLRTLEVDVERAARLRERVPDDRLVIGESGVREPATVARWRALGFDGALIGEALVRAADPAAAVRAFVAAGTSPDDPANVARRPFVKICGVTDLAGVLAAIAAGADAIGLNVVPGTPRELALDEAADLARIARAAGGDRRPAIVAITADAKPAFLAAVITAFDPDVVQLAGTESVAMARAVGRRTWKVLQVPPAEPDDLAAAADDLVSRGHAYLAAGVDRIMLDAAGGPHPGGTGTRASERLAAAVAREMPVVLAGGLAPANVAEALRTIPATAVDVASGVERPRSPDVRPTKDPLKVALFVKRARAARDDRPNIPFGPTPVHAGLLDADGAGRWGMEGDFGGRYVPETLMAALEQLEHAYDALRQDPVFWAELRELLGTFAGRPTALYRADRLAAAVRAEAERLAGPRGSGIPGLRLYLKREDLAHTGAHKINNALGQALLTRRLGKTRVIAETGAGQHGVATATACALLDLPCVVYMGAEDIERQGPNVLRMRALGAEVRSVTSGTATLKDAVNEAMRDWVTNVETTHYVLGSAMGPHPYPTIVRDLQRRIGDEAAAQITTVEGRLPDLAVACVGGGSNAIGLLARFIGEPSVRLAVVEAAGDGIETGRHAAAILGGTPGILHGSRSLMLQDADGQVIEAHSASAGLDYPGIGPQLAALAEGGRIEVAAATDREAVAAMKATTRTEGILPALETAHAVAALPKLLAGIDGVGGSWPDEVLVLLGFSGRGDKDLAALERFADVEPWESVR